MKRPLLLYDGDCGFCRRRVAKWEWRTRGRVEFVAFDHAGERAPDVAPSSLREAIHLVEPDGRVTRGAGAYFRMRALGNGAWLGSRLGPWLYARAPGFASVAEAAYRLVASQRSWLSPATTLLCGRDPRPSTYLVSRGLFLRLLGVIHIIAVWSLWTQIHGLVGSRGILPIASFLERVRAGLGASGYWKLPTFCWIDASDAALHVLCAAGVALGALLAIGVAPIPVLVLLWAVYLSLAVAGQVFLGFQWDTLLLETTFCALFVAPAVLLLRPSRARPPCRAGIVLLWLVLFKLMFLSGITKLLSGDTTWRDGSALDYHYFTQPIPTWMSWHMHQLPAWFQRASVGGMLFVETVVPFLLFGPRRVRHAAALLLVLLQVGVALTGNYGFFNLLTIVLCVPLLDDAVLRRLASPPWTAEESARRGPRGGWLSRTQTVVASVVIGVSGLALLDEMERTRRPGSVPAWVAWTLDRVDGLVLRWGRPGVLEPLRPFRTINGYGLFRVMTTERPEIVIEGSPFAMTWRPYEFRWKAGDPKTPPRFVAPHMPRLDWQMCFAALNPGGNGYWLESLANALMEGRPEVLALLGENPFPDDPPRSIRFILYRYEFTDRKQRAVSNAWWRRRETRRYPPISRPPRYAPAPPDQSRKRR